MCSILLSSPLQPSLTHIDFGFPEPSSILIFILYKSLKGEPLAQADLQWRMIFIL